MLRTARVKVHGGDYDCSEAVRMCYAAAGVLHWDYWKSYMWTGNEPETLLSRDFVKVPVSAASNMRRGDVLLKTGHTEMYLGSGIQAGARGDERGGIGHGARKGDQTGYELAKSSYRQGQWEQAFRYTGPVNINGIPAAEIAAQVMEHLVAHDSSHGYSQPARAGDGTVETIEIRWDDGKKPPKEEWEVKPAIISIKGRNTQVYTDWHDVHDLSSPSARDSLRKLYKATNGEDIRIIEATPEEFAHLAQALRSDWPKHLKDLVEKYKSRSPEGTY